MTDLPTVVIADDHPSIRHSLRRAFRNKLDIVAEADNAAMMIAKVMVKQPDLVVADYQMPGMGSLDACETIVDQTEAKVLLFTGLSSEHLIDRSLRIGISGVAFKARESGEDVCAVLLDMHYRNATYFAPEWHARHEAIESGRLNYHGITELTPRQLAILQNRCCGLTNEEIMYEHDIARTTLGNELAAARKLLGAKTNDELMTIATEEGLVSHSMCSQK